MTKMEEMKRRREQILELSRLFLTKIITRSQLPH